MCLRCWWMEGMLLECTCAGTGWSEMTEHLERGVTRLAQNETHNRRYITWRTSDVVCGFTTTGTGRKKTQTLQSRRQTQMQCIYTDSWLGKIIHLYKEKCFAPCVQLVCYCQYYYICLMLASLLSTETQLSSSLVLKRLFPTKLQRLSVLKRLWTDKKTNIHLSYCRRCLTK